TARRGGIVFMGSRMSDGSRQDSGRGMECQKGRLKTLILSFPPTFTLVERTVVGQILESDISICHNT
ncbi:hypothetical protein, partial [Staphylococcus hominis]|uniref:hypothetical protein n=1 Tax=Staphylococcus hominis TaxID=1290 RepID=UPI001C92E97F